jgi:hypothetical protein
MRDLIELLGMVKYDQANEAIQIAKGKYELPSVKMKRMFKKLMHRNHGR